MLRLNSGGGSLSGNSMGDINSSFSLSFFNDYSTGTSVNINDSELN